MKTILYIRYQKIRMLLLFCIFLLIMQICFTSCKKSEGPTYENFTSANITVLNAWNNEDDPELTFHLDTSKRLHTGTIQYGRQLSPYMIVYAGNREAKFKINGTDNVVLKKNLNLESKKIYSLFLTGSKAAPELISVEDNVAQEPAAGKYWVRLANMTTDGDQYELRFAKDGQALTNAVNLITAVGTKNVSLFKESNADANPTQRYTVWAIAPGIDTVTFDRVVLASQKAYTFTIAGSENTGFKSTNGFTFTNVLPY